ncbi:MAG: ABC transporter ATP-binding protein [Bacteroidales bacterium]|nr:ABC transporter ATP-binding protein [Bacteroidales bacterium]
MSFWRASIREFANLLWNVRWRLVVSCAIGLLRVAVSLAFVWICKHAVDIATGECDDQLAVWVIAMFAAMVLRVATLVAASYWENIILVRTQNEMRMECFSTTMHGRFRCRETLHSGDVVNRLEEDVRVVCDMLCSNVPAVLTTIVQLIAAFSFLYCMAPTLAWILLLVMPVALFVSKAYFKKMRELTLNIREADSRVQEQLQESVQQRILIQTLEATGKIVERLGMTQHRKYLLVESRLRYSSVARACVATGFMTGYAIAFLWGVFGLQHHAVTYGMMTAFLQLVAQIQRPMADLSQHIPAFIHTLASVDRLTELRRQPTDAGLQARKLSGCVGVRVEHLTFAYPDSPVPLLSDFSHDFKPGTSTVIMGETGSGKTSFVRLLLAVLSANEGKGWVYDQQREVELSEATRCNFMYVPQGNSLMSGTIRENLHLANPNASDAELEEVLHVAVADFVWQLPRQLDTVCNEQGGGLSEGQAQRIAIARALLRPGGILILDESTSALDQETEGMLLERLNAYVKGRKTLIWVSHHTILSHHCEVLSFDGQANNSQSDMS